MKKNLAIRAGAVVMVLMVAFFSILPDLVNAEGDDPEPLAEEQVLAEAPEDAVSDTDVMIEDASGEEAPTDDVEVPTDDVEAPTDDAEAPGEEMPDDTASVPEVPETEVSDDETQPEEPSETEMPDEEVSDQEKGEAPADKDTEEEIPDAGGSLTQEPVVEAPSSNVPQETEQTAADEGTVDDGAMDTVEDYIDILIETGSADKIRNSAKSISISEDEIQAFEDLMDSDLADFIIEGTTIVGYTGEGGYIKIPDVITAIGDSAFAGNTTILGVVLPTGLQSIGSSAFNGCINLEGISIPEAVTSVGDSAFANCTGLAGVSIGAGTGTVSQNEFNNCISLQSVEVPEGISSVAAGAFSGCSNLSSVSLPSTMASIDRNAFSGDVNLASISVASGSYSSYDGCVYTANNSQLLICPEGKTGISFAPGMQSVASGAFSGCNYLLAASLPNSTGTIEANAFSGSTIKSVTIPTNVTSIGSQSGWTPNVVYGYTGSTAESWANANNYVFESLNGTSQPASGTDEHIEDPDPAVNEPDPPVDKPNKGSNTPGKNASGSPTGSGMTAAISRNGSSRVNATTPKTGVEDYGVYFLFAAIFLIGVAFFAYSRKLRFDKTK